jgi:hypothetical protein
MFHADREQDAVLDALRSGYPQEFGQPARPSELLFGGVRQRCLFQRDETGLCASAARLFDGGKRLLLRYAAKIPRRCRLPSAMAKAES